MKIRVKGHVVGDLEDGVFFKKVRSSAHLFRKLNAWGIDGNVFTKCLLPINATIVVYDEEEGKRYQCTARQFEAKGTWLHFKEGTSDHYAQIFLPLKDWETPKIKVETLEEKLKNYIQ